MNKMLLYRDFALLDITLSSKIFRIRLFARFVEGKFASLTPARAAFDLVSSCLYTRNKKKVSWTPQSCKISPEDMEATRGRSGEEKEVLSGELITSRWINDSDISNKSCQTLTPEPALAPSHSLSLSPFFPFMLSLFCPLIHVIASAERVWASCAFYLYRFLSWSEIHTNQQST